VHRRCRAAETAAGGARIAAALVALGCAGAVAPADDGDPGDDTGGAASPAAPAATARTGPQPAGAADAGPPRDGPPGARAEAPPAPGAGERVDAGAGAATGRDGGAAAEPGAPPVVTADDPSEAVLSLAVFHQIALEVSPADLPALLNDRTKTVPCKIVYDGRELPLSTAHRKGLTSGSSTKPSLVVKFDEVNKKQNLGGLDKLVLNNAKQDPSFLNEHLAYEVYRLAGLPAPRTAHGVVTINGKTYGLYVVQEATDKQFLARWFTPAYRHGNLYEGGLRDFVADQTLGRWPNELDLKNEVEEQRTRDDIIALANVVKTAPDAEYEARLGQRLDFKAFLTAFAIDMILGNWDDYFYASNNYYLYNNPRDGRFVLIPHGADWLFSPRDSFPTSRPLATLDPFVPLASLRAGVGPGRMAARVRAIPALEAKLRAEVARVIRQVWDVPKLRARLGRAEATIRGHKTSDARLLADVASFEKQLPVMRELLEARKLHMQQLAP
jgi:hypothetical protein